MELTGEIKDVIFKNELNSYTVANLETLDGTITIVGYLPFVNKGDNLKAEGNFIEHIEYGKQFKVETFEKVIPTSKDGLQRYLSSGIIKGIGPATAKKIIKKFGTDTISILRYEPEKLADIKGITIEKAIDISQSFNENTEVWKIVEYLQKYGIGPQGAEKIYKKLGTNTINEIEQNPYILIDLVRKADFKQIDSIALKTGFDAESTKRINSGIKYALKIASTNGHCCVLYENLIQFCETLLETSKDLIEESIISLKTKKEIFLEDREDGEWVYLSYFYKAEKSIAEKLIELDKYINIKEIKEFDKKLKEIEKNTELELSQKQIEAVQAVQNHNVTVITGGPGTGKTTIIKTIIDLYKQEKKKVVLCAPTGRAAKKMTESTGEEAKTLHRLLEIGATSTDEYQNADDIQIEPLDADVIIVDEMSMVDLILMNYLIQAIYKGTKLVLVGDINQLPSVGPRKCVKRHYKFGTDNCNNSKQNF